MIPLPTTTIRVYALTGEPYEVKSEATVVSGVPAHIGSPSGRARRRDGVQSPVDADLVCDLCPIVAGNMVEDLSTGVRWRVAWADTHPDVGGVGHVAAGLDRVDGVR